MLRGQQRVNTPFRTRGIALLGRSMGSGGATVNTFPVREDGVENALGWETPGTHRGHETFLKLLGLTKPQSSYL